MKPPSNEEKLAGAEAVAGCSSGVAFADMVWKGNWAPREWRDVATGAIPVNGACCVIMTFLAMLAGVGSCGTGACSRCRRGCRLSFNSFDNSAMLDLTISVTNVFTLSGTGVDGVVTGAVPESSPCPPSTFDDEAEGCELIVLARVKLRPLRRFAVAVSFGIVNFVYFVATLVPT